MIRVLICDDSATVRSLLSAIFAADPELQVVGEAADGVQAIAQTRKLRPDVVTMDVRMPNMDGFEATKEIMIETPTPIVIVTGSRSMHEVEMSMYALRAGALAILEKPAGPTSPGFDEAAKNLISLVKAMAQVKVVRHWRPKVATRSAAAPAAPTSASSRARVVAVASSTGGPAALHDLFSGIPADFPLPILVVQHISRSFVHGLADWLNKAVPLQVKVAEDAELLNKHTVYLAPDDRHLGVSPGGTVMLSAAPAIGGFRPSATFLFDSVAKAYGSSCAAVMLTGMGEDGVAGLQAVRRVGGRIFAQDEKSSVVFGMPAAAIAAGLADDILPPPQIARRLVDLVNGNGES